MAFGQVGLIARFAATNLPTTATKTMIQVVSPPSSRVVVNQIAISFNGVSNTDEPYQVQLLRQLGDGTATAVTVVRANTDDTVSIGSTSRGNFSVEPTARDVLASWYVHPQVGILWEPPIDSPIIISQSANLGLRILAPIVQANSATGYISFVE